MSEITQVAAQPAQQPQFLSAAEGAKMLAARREQTKTETNPVSDAARTLGQRAAEARKQRTTEAPREAKASQEEVQHVEDEQALAAVEPQDEAETAETPSEQQEAQETPESDDGVQIDLGEGVKLTKAEIREGIMLKADHTRRLQADAGKRKAFETLASQKLGVMDQAIELLGQRIGNPKPLSQFMKDLGDPVAAAEAFDAQQAEIAAFQAARTLAGRQRAELVDQAIDQRDGYLAEHHNTEWADPEKREQAYTALTQFALKHGAKPDQLRNLTDPWMIQVLDWAMQHKATEAAKAKVTKAVGAKPPVVRPGTKVNAGAAAQSNLQTAQAQLKKSGSLADAVALLRARRGTGG